MGGLAALISILGYCVFVFCIVKFLSGRVKIITNILICIFFIALPFLDAKVGRIMLDKKCQNDSNISIFYSVSNVEGIGVRGGVFKSSPKYYGYRFVEGGFSHVYKYVGNTFTSDFQYMFARAEVDKDGNEMKIQKGIVPKVKYMLDEKLTKKSTYFIKERISIIEIKTGRELSGFNWYSFRGGWAERFLMIFTGAGSKRSFKNCGGYELKRNKTIELLHRTLKPSSFKKTS